MDIYGIILFLLMALGVCPKDETYQFGLFIFTVIGLAILLIAILYVFLCEVF